MKKVILSFLCVAAIANATDLPDNLYQIHQKRFLKELYYTIKPMIKLIKNTVLGIPNSLLNIFLHENPHGDDEATVRFANNDELGPEELQFLVHRMEHVKQSINALFDANISKHQVPRIAVCCSGGGYRAMMLTFGFLKGLNDIGLLDCTTYMAGLSGSTWAMAPWVASKNSLDEYIETLPSKLYQGLEIVKQPYLLKKFVGLLITKAYYGQFMSMIDLTGPTLANTLLADFDEERLNVTLSDSHAHIADGKLPLPIYTSVSADVEPYEWVEFTPFEVGSTYQKAYIPTWAYGRKFKFGESINYAPEQSLGYMMGIFGSAFGIDIEDAARHTSSSIESFANNFGGYIKGIIHDIIDRLVNSPLDDVRMAPSTLPNFTYKTENCPLNEDKMLTLIDAGIHFNLPLPPLMRKNRNIDIILICDASGAIMECQNLHWAQEYMIAKGHKFPPIDFATADKKVMSIFRDENDPDCPIVVYFPRIKNEAYSTSFDPELCQANDYCHTVNFTYNEQQVHELMGLSEFAVKQHAEQLLALTKEVINNKA